MQLVIYGAQGYALGAYEAIKSLYPKRVMPCFLVSRMGNNASVLGDLPVREIASFAEGMPREEKKNVEVLIATPENIHPEIEETLEDHGFIYHRRIDHDRWTELMKMFHVKMGRFLPLSALPVGCREPFVRVYMARSHKDMPLNEHLELPDYVPPLQVGAANTDLRIAALSDGSGDNISAKNVNYSELTGLYWIWKNKLGMNGNENEDCQYYGLAQYRRMLEFSRDDLLRLADNDVDVILPYPMPYEPDINAHHERYLKKVDFNALLTVLSELQPEYAKFLPEVLSQKYLYNYNVILARKAVLREYCGWLFPILERTEELSVPKGSERADRYIGYMGETLETLYYMKNADRLNIVHTGCRMFV